MPTLAIEVNNCTTNGVEVTEVGENLYRLDDEPLLFLGAENDEAVDHFARYGDTFLAERVDDQTIRYLSLHARGPYRHHDRTLGRPLEEHHALRDVLATVVAEGGSWWLDMGAFLFIAVPEQSAFDVAAELERINRLD